MCRHVPAKPAARRADSDISLLRVSSDLRGYWPQAASGGTGRSTARRGVFQGTPTQLCRFYPTLQDLLDTVAPFFKVGLRDILADVPGQHLVDEGLISDSASTCFLAELIEHFEIDSDRNQPARLVPNRRAPDAPHGLHLPRG